MRHKKGRKIKPGIKYCGGCNPKYDRADVVKKMQHVLKDKVDFGSLEDEEISGILVVVGCETACVDASRFKKIPIWVITQPGDAEKFICDMK